MVTDKFMHSRYFVISRYNDITTNQREITRIRDNIEIEQVN